MKKLSLVIFLVGLTVLLFLTNNRDFQEGTIKSFSSSDSKTTIQLTNSENNLVIFQKITGIKDGDKIKFLGDEEVYKNETQIIVDKLYVIK